MKTPLSKEQRLERMQENLQRPLPRLSFEEEKPGIISICGFGPSLIETYQEINGDVLTTSGAHDFLISKGIIPKYHVETDPREHKVNFVRNSHPDVTYLINSQCHPKMFEALTGRTVLMWHGFTDDDAANQIALLEQAEPGVRLMGGGTNAGMRAMVVARELGFTRFELHGMDCSYRGETQWAGNHYTAPHDTVKIEVEGNVFETSPMMMQSTDDFFNQMRMLYGCSFKIYGDGLLEARMQMFLRDREKALSQSWWKPIGFVVQELISDQYVELSRELHKDEKYGVSGKKRAKTVIDLCQELATTNVLDYGCGKGTLADALPFGISEYDPAIAGKDAHPKPAELVVCSDVLEHIEPQNLDAVLCNLRHLTIRAGYFVAHTGAARKALPDGRNAHLIQKPSSWWAQKLAGYFRIRKQVNYGLEAHFLVEPI